MPSDAGVVVPEIKPDAVRVHGVYRVVDQVRGLPVAQFQLEECAEEEISDGLSRCTECGALYATLNEAEHLGGVVDRVDELERDAGR